MLVAATALTLSVVLCGCASVFSELPSPVGLPPGTPERSAVQPEFPAVHDMPPPRETKLLSEDERRKLEAELAAVRDRQSGKAGPAARKKPQ